MTNQNQAWRDRIEVVAINPPAAFKKTITGYLPNAKITVDPFHLAQLGNLCLTRVRQHLTHDLHQHRDRKTRSRVDTPDADAPRLQHLVGSWP